MVEVELVPDASEVRRPPSSGLVREVFWPLARRADGLQHLSARVGGERIAVVLFVGSTDGCAAVRQTRALCERVTRLCPLLAGWSVDRCELADGLF